VAYSVTNSKGDVYYLHSKEAILRGGRKQKIFYFGKEVKAGALNELPEGYTVIENEKTKLPMLKKIEK